MGIQLQSTPETLLRQRTTAESSSRRFPMAALLSTLILLLFFSKSFVGTNLGVGINYGQITNNLPSPSRVSILLGSLNISRVKLYDADPNVLNAFANTNIKFIIGLGNKFLEKIEEERAVERENTRREEENRRMSNRLKDIEAMLARQYPPPPSVNPTSRDPPTSARI